MNMELSTIELNKIKLFFSKIEVKRAIGLFNVEDEDHLKEIAPESFNLTEEESLLSNSEKSYYGNSVFKLWSINLFGGDGKCIESQNYNDIRRELEDNLSMPIDFSLKKSYIEELISLLCTLESQIKEEGTERFTYKNLSFIDIEADKLDPKDKDILSSSLKSLKRDLRTEIAYLYTKVHELTEKSQSNHGSIKWTTKDIYLLEIIISLYELGAIQNDTKDLTQIGAIQAFGGFFGKELKYEYKKLNSARKRKRDDPNFIMKMWKALEAYNQGLNEEK
jgi:hypothetical protein